MTQGSSSLVGFKSVFTVADVVSILSGPYTFKFDKHKPLGMIAPIWISEPQAEYHPGETTFLLELSPAMEHEDLKDRLRDIQPSLLLFLRKLRRIEITTDEGTAVLGMYTDRHRVTQLTHTGRGAQPAKRYILSRHNVNVSCDEKKRSGITRSEIVLAFPVSESLEPMESWQDVHAFLPLRRYGFRVSLFATSRSAI